MYAKEFPIWDNKVLTIFNLSISIQFMIQF